VSPAPPGRLATERRAGWLLIAFVLAVRVPFARLAAVFDYPDVLRRPAGDVLSAFAAGDDALVLTWYVYAGSVGLFGLAVLAIGHADPRRSTLTTLGLSSALLQGLALARWTLAVPWLARQHAAADPGLRAVLEVQFDLLNQFLGVGVGEHLGQVLMLAWTLGMRRVHPRGSRLLGGLSTAAVLLLGIGLLEQLATALGRDGSSLAPFSTVGFLLWSAWLLGLGIRWVRGGPRDGRWQS
jgi:hypothetical protein